MQYFDRRGGVGEVGRREESQAVAACADGARTGGVGTLCLESRVARYRGRDIHHAEYVEPPAGPYRRRVAAFERGEGIRTEYVPRQYRCRHSRPIASQPSRYNSCRGATVLRLRSHARRAGGPLSAFDAQGRRRSRDPQHGALVRPAVGLVVQCFRRFDATVVPTRRAAHATPRARGASKRFVHAFARCRACGAVRGIQHYDALRVCPSACHYLLFSGRIASSGDGSRPTAHVVGRVVSRRVGGADAIAASRKESLQRHAHDVRPTHSPISRTRRRLDIGVVE